MDNSAKNMYNSAKGSDCVLYLSASGTREIRACNTNYFPEGSYHPNQYLEEYDFLYIKEGSWHVCEDENVYAVRDGHVLILEPHRHLSSLDRCTPGMKNMFLHCAGLPGDFNEPAGRSPLPDSQDYFCLEKMIDCAGNPQIESLFSQIIETYWTQSVHRAGLIDSLLFLLMAELEKTGKPREQHDPLISEIIHQFYLHSDQVYSPQELADAHKISVRSLSSRFKAATGMSIHQYQMNLKLDVAHEQLRLNPGWHLRELALSLGFYDEFHFSKMYKRRFGKSPSSNRRL